MLKNKLVLKLEKLSVHNLQMAPKKYEYIYLFFSPIDELLHTQSCIVKLASIYNIEGMLLIIIC